MCTVGFADSGNPNFNGVTTTNRVAQEPREHGKGGLSLRGVAFMTVLAVLTDLESTLPSFCLSYKIQHNEATVAVLTVLAVSAVMAVSIITATPLKLNPPFP